MRINVRLTDDVAAQLRKLKKLTGKNTAELIAAALRAYSPQVALPKNAYEVFKKAGFIGGHAGPKDASRNYKKGLFRPLERKPRQR